MTGPRLRRAYFETQFGQLHVHSAIPAGGGFDERTTLICVHPRGVSGRFFAALLPGLGQDRSVYAPDLPGCAESDGPAEATPADLGQALLEFIAEMRFRQLDLLAFGTGIDVAREIARARPTLVRRCLELPTRGNAASGTEAPLRIDQLADIRARLDGAA